MEQEPMTTERTVLPIVIDPEEVYMLLCSGFVLANSAHAQCTFLLDLVGPRRLPFRVDFQTAWKIMDNANPRIRKMTSLRYLWAKGLPWQDFEFWEKTNEEPEDQEKASTIAHCSRCGKPKLNLSKWCETCQIALGFVPENLR